MTRSRHPAARHLARNRGAERLESRALLATVLLNEVSVNPPGADEPFEYVEIKGTPGALLTNVYAVALEGDDDQGCGTADLVVDLSTIRVGANGLLMIKATNGGHTPPTGTTVVADARFDIGPGILENNSNSFALIRATAGPIVAGTDLDPDNDGLLDLPAGAALLDAIGWLSGSSSLDRAYGVQLTQSSGSPDAASRLRHSVAPLQFDAWFNADLVGESRASVTYDAMGASANLPAGAVLTPGGHNYSAAATNAAPLARDAQYATPLDQTLDVTEALGLLRTPGELDADGDLLGVTNVDATSLPADHALNVQADGSFSYTPAPGFEGEVTFSYQVTDGEALSAAGVVSIQVGNVNSPPSISLSVEPRLYAENGPALLITPEAVIEDADSDSFAGGTLHVQVAAGLDAAKDQLSVRSLGSAAGQIEVLASDVRFEGTSMGTLERVSESSVLVHLSDGASQAAVQALVRSFTFRTRGDNPSIAARSIEFQVSDGPTPGDGAVSPSVAKTVNVAAVNDRPFVALGGGVRYRENQGAVQIASGGSLGDADDDHFGGGSLTVALASGGETTDELSIVAVGGISSSGSSVLYNGVTIGTVSGGFATGSPLVIALNENATPAAAQALLRAIAFRSTSENPTAGPHVVTFTLNDGSLNSLPRSKTVNVVAVNDRPVITGGGRTIDYVRNSAAFNVFPSARVVEDQPTFSGGSLTVTNLDGQAADRLLIRGAFRIEAGTNKLLLDGLEIGAVNAGGGQGTANLVVTFNENATRAIVEQLLRSIRFRTHGSSDSLVGLRTIRFTLVDTFGLTGNTAWNRVNVL